MSNDNIMADFPPEARGARVLPGFIGKSDRSGFVRLHRLRDINEYLDIKTEDVVLKKEVDASEAQGARCKHALLWVKHTAVIDYTSVETFNRDGRAVLLRGRIVRGCFEGTAPTSIPVQGLDLDITAGSSGEQSNTSLDCWHCCSTYISGC